MKFFDIFKKKKPTMNPFKKRKFKIGLALGGGGARGISHLGVIKAFEEFGLKFDVIAGTSVGSLVGAFWASGLSFEQMNEIAKEIRKKDIKTNKIPFMTSSTEGIEKIVINSLGDIDIKDLKIPFAAVAVDIKTTEEVVITKGNLAKAVAGSCCVPGIFQPVEFEDMLLCDGGLQNTLPGNVPRLMGCDFVVSVDVNSARIYGTESSKVLDVLSASIRTLMKSNVVKGYLNSDIVLQPNTKRFKSTKLDDYELMIEEGYNEALSKIPEIMKIFSSLKKKKKNIPNTDEKINFLE